MTGDERNNNRKNAASASESSLLFEIRLIDQKMTELDKNLNEIYSLLDIKLGGDEVKRVLELKSMLDESAKRTSDIGKDIGKISQSLQETNEKLAHLESENSRLNSEVRKSEKEIEAVRKYILNAGPTIYDLTGITGASALIITSILIFSDRWDVVRAWYYPMVFGIALAIAAIVALKSQRNIKKRLVEQVK
ncbi:MAG: hypothetical protein EPN24_07425 [Candidatus Methanoperedens sp.]|nr:MAG: hypothetical protein EPN24_07425 [Candidatus Methanoperedens sp.]